MHVLHRPFVLATPLGATSTSWHGEVLMLGDDVIGRHLPRPFIMPKQLFAPVNGSHKVFPLAQMLHEIETLDSSANVATVLIVDDAVPAEGYDSLNVRHTCLVPPSLAHLVLGSTMVPHHMLAAVAAFVGPQNYEAYAPILDYLRVAATHRAVIEKGSPSVPFGHTGLLADAMMAQVRRDLPSWSPDPSPAINTALEMRLATLEQRCAADIFENFDLCMVQRKSTYVQLCTFCTNNP